MQIDTDSIFICTSEGSPGRKSLEVTTEIVGGETEEVEEKGATGETEEVEETGIESKMSESGRSTMTGITIGSKGGKREARGERSLGGGRGNPDRTNQRSNTCKNHSTRSKTMETAYNFYQITSMYQSY